MSRSLCDRQAASLALIDSLNVITNEFVFVRLVFFSGWRWDQRQQPTPVRRAIRAGIQQLLRNGRRRRAEKLLLS